MICNECNTIVGFEDDGSDQSYLACNGYDCHKVYCVNCVENENIIFFCYECRIHLCRWCIVSVRDPDDDSVELGTSCPHCCEIGGVGPVNHV